MILIVDTNVIFAGLLRNSVTRQLLFNPSLTLCAPETALKEIRKYEGEIVKRAGFSKEEFWGLLNLIRPNDGIWTENAKHFKNAKVKIWTTKELMRSRMQ